MRDSSYQDESLMEHETPKSIWYWMKETFGHEGMSDRYMVTRAMDELHEALDALDVSEENTHGMSKEIIDVLIICYGILGKRGYDMPAAIDAKMRVNRGRKWEYRNGKWQHVEEVR